MSPTDRKGKDKEGTEDDLFSKVPLEKIEGGAPDSKGGGIDFPSEERYMLFCNLYYALLY